MPEPTTDIKGRKKLGKNAIILIGVGALALFYVYKKKKEKEENQPPTGQNPYTAQSFIPVTGENVAGVGAGGGGFGGAPTTGNAEELQFLTQAQKENTQFLTEYLKSSQQSQKEFLESFQEKHQALTGGGSPSSGQVNTGGGTASPPSGGSPGVPPPPPAGREVCGSGKHAGFPLGNPPDCYRISRTRASHNCECHGHQDGRLECQHWNGRQCVW